MVRQFKFELYLLKLQLQILLEFILDPDKYSFIKMRNMKFKI